MCRVWGAAWLAGAISGRSQQAFCSASTALIWSRNSRAVEIAVMRVRYDGSARPSPVAQALKPRSTGSRSKGRYPDSLVRTRGL